jgi:hypothetical protein
MEIIIPIADLQSIYSVADAVVPSGSLPSSVRHLLRQAAPVRREERGGAPVRGNSAVAMGHVSRVSASPGDRSGSGFPLTCGFGHSA